MSKPDASKQYKPGGIIGDRETIAYVDGGLYCWNCELSFKSMEVRPPTFRFISAARSAHKSGPRASRYKIYSTSAG